MNKETSEDIKSKLPEWYSILRELYLKACDADSRPSRKD
jgi:hypothetical protein